MCSALSLSCFDPCSSFSGNVTFDYTIQDADGKQSTAKATLVVAEPAALAPVTVNYTAVANTDFIGPASLLDGINSTNPGANLTVLGLTSTPPAAVGQVVVSPNGSFVFKPASNWVSTLIGFTTAPPYTPECRSCAGPVNSTSKAVIPRKP